MIRRGELSFSRSAPQDRRGYLVLVDFGSHPRLPLIAGSSPVDTNRWSTARHCPPCHTDRSYSVDTARWELCLRNRRFPCRCQGNVPGECSPSIFPRVEIHLPMGIASQLSLRGQRTPTLLRWGGVCQPSSHRPRHLRRRLEPPDIFPDRSEE